MTPDDRPLGEAELECLRGLQLHAEVDPQRCSQGVLEQLLARGLIERSGGVGLPGFAAGQRYRLSAAGRLWLAAQ